MEDNLNYYNKLKVVPDTAKKQIAAGRLRGFTDINPMWRIKVLTENFGVCGFGWRYEITRYSLETGGNGEIAAFITINLFVKINSVWSAAIPGVGGSSFVANEQKGLYTSDECFKMALTDALSVACKALGIGADVYFEKDRSKYDGQQEQKPVQEKPLCNNEILKKAIAKAKAGEADVFENLQKYYRLLPDHIESFQYAMEH